MKSIDLYRKALISFLDEKNTQSSLADALKFPRPNINDFLKGRRNFSEEKLQRIAAYFGKTYLEMLVLGQELFDKENNVSPKKETKTLSKNNDLNDHQDKQHSEVIKQFKQKKLAKECNMKMLELEKLDPSELLDVKEYLDFKLEKRKKKIKAAKKKANGM